MRFVPQHILRFVLLMALLLVSTTGIAKKLYKYQDESGWHYTDQPPNTDKPVEIRQLKVSGKQRVWLEKSGDPGNPDFFVINQYPGPIEVAVNWGEHDNVTASPDLPHNFVVAPGTSSTLFKVIPSIPGQATKFSLEYRYIVGSPINNYVSNTLYLPPIAPGIRFQITQAFGGEFSHNDAQNQYAVDIMMPVNTPIYAARGGIVLDVDNDYFESGTKQTLASKANSIRILHDDGSMSVYAHLAVESALVYPGLTVATGDRIGFSGNTGLTTGPHLHFAVQVNHGMELVSVPFQFSDQENRAVDPQVGLWLAGYVRKNAMIGTDKR